MSAIKIDVGLEKIVTVDFAKTAEDPKTAAPVVVSISEPPKASK